MRNGLKPKIIMQKQKKKKHMKSNHTKIVSVRQLHRARIHHQQYIGDCTHKEDEKQKKTNSKFTGKNATQILSLHIHTSTHSIMYDGILWQQKNRCRIHVISKC